MIVRLTELGANVNDGSGTPLYYLIENGNFNMANYLIANGANLKAGRVLFQAAINSQKIESIDFLIDIGVDLVGKNQIDYLSQAFTFLKKEINGIKEDSQQSLPALEIFCRLLELGANPNFWISSEGLNPKNYEQALNRCLLWLALELPAQTNAQYFYKNYLIQVLLDHGVNLPDLGIHILGVYFSKRKDTWYFKVPFRKGIHHETGEEVTYPLFVFEEHEKQRAFINALHVKGREFIENRLSDTENPLVFLKMRPKSVQK